MAANALEKSSFIVIAFSFLLEAEFLFLESCASYFYIYVDITISKNTEPVYDAAMMLFASYHVGSSALTCRSLSWLLCNEHRVLVCFVALVCEVFCLLYY